MTGIITRSHRLKCRRCKNLPSGKSCCNVRYLISAKQMSKKPAKACTAGAYNAKEGRVISRKKEFCQEVNKLMLQKGEYSKAYDSVGKDNLREGPTASVNKRITRSTGKFMLETESSNIIRGDAACKDARNDMEGEKNDKKAKELNMNSGENSNEADVEFGLKNQDRKLEVRMTRSKKNLLLQIQADKENVDGCLHDQKVDGSCSVDSDNQSPILTYNHTLQRKRKRMSVKMYDEGLEDPFCISEKDLGSKHHTKKVIPFRAITRNAIHKQNARSVINAKTTQRERESDADLENQRGDVQTQELPEDTVHPQVEENEDMILCSEDAQYGYGSVRNTESAFDKEEVNPVLASDSSLNARKDVDRHTMAGSRRAKVIAVGSIPKRVTRSMQNEVLNLDQVQINGKPMITHKKKNKKDHSMEVKNSLRTKRQSHSHTVECREETQLRDESCPKDKRIMKLNSIEPILIRSGKSVVTEHDNSSSIDVLGKSKEVEDLQGKDHVYRISRRKEKQKYDMPRKEYLTRSKHNESNIQDDKEIYSLILKTERSISPCNKNKLNSNIREAGDADGSPLANEPAVLELNESAKDNTVRPSSMCIENKEESSKSSIQATTVSEQNGKFSIGSQSDVPCYEQICNDSTPKTLGCSSAVDEIQSGAPLFAGNIDHVGRKSGDLAVSNVGHLETNAHVTSSIRLDGTCLESERQTCEAPFISRRVNDPVGKSHKGKVDEHNSMQHNDFSTKDKKKSVKFMNNPNDLGARHIRPRPLDPLQPLPVFIEGCDQDFYDLDSISLPWHPTQSEEENLNSVSVDGEVASKSKQRSMMLKSKKEEIKIPSYRTVSDYADLRRSLLGGKSIYSIPGSYIKHIEMSAKNSIIGLEYDIEDDDQEWLRNFNKGIAGKKPSFKLTEDKFEELIEYFEKKSVKVSAVQVAKFPSKDSLKDWKDKSNMNTTLKTKKMPNSDTGKQELELPREKASAMLSSLSQTSECCICNGGENSVSNLIYRCKGCGIYVHQSCYGVNDQKIAGHTDRLQTSQWLCRKCEAFGSGNIHIWCAICCKNGGALKPTTNPAKWAHVVCALYTDETFFLDTDSMEPIDGVSAVEARLRKQKRLCCFCGARVGSCERCSVYGCEVMFHISCGVSRGAYFELQHNNQRVVSVRSFCPQHANMAVKAPKNKKDKAEKRTYSSDLGSLAISSEADETNFSQQKCDDAGQLQCVLLQSNSTYNGFLGEGSNVKDACQVPVKDDASVLKRQKTQKLKHGFRSAVRLNKLKTENRNKMYLIDEGLDSQRSAKGSSVQLMARSQQQHGSHLSDHVQNEGRNLDLIESCTSGRWNANESDRYPCIKLKDVLKEKIGPAFVVREVYSYWFRKRAKKKGPLLQEIQQEEAARTHDIFNRDSAGIREYFGVKEDCPVDFKMFQKHLSELQRDLKSVRSIAELIIKREKVKAELCSYFQGRIELKLLSLQEELGLMYCFLCKSSENLLHCAQCKRIFCFKCYKHWKVHGLKSYRIESCRKCFCKDCEVVDKTDSVGVELEKSSMKSEEERERSSQSPHALGQSSKANLKLDGECRAEGLEAQDASFPDSIAKHEVVENTDSRVNTSNIPSMQEINNICNFPPFTAQIGSLGLIDGDPLDDKWRQRSSCRTVPLSQLSDVVSLNTASLVKLPPTDCHNNVQKTRYKRRKLETLDPISISS